MGFDTQSNSGQYLVAVIWISVTLCISNWLYHPISPRVIIAYLVRVLPIVAISLIGTYTKPDTLSVLTRLKTQCYQYAGNRHRELLL